MIRAFFDLAAEQNFAMQILLGVVTVLALAIALGFLVLVITLIVEALDQFVSAITYRIQERRRLNDQDAKAARVIQQAVRAVERKQKYEVVSRRR